MTTTTDLGHIWDRERLDGEGPETIEVGIDFDALKAQSRDLRDQLRAALDARDTWKREAERLESFHEQRAEDADG